MNNNQPLVSTIIPTYKRANMLPRAIDSVLNQTYAKVEIIVVDDNSPNTEYREDTEKIMQQYLVNPRVKYIRHEKNKNGSAARNTGIRHSNGELICFLDDDDWYYPEKVEKQVAYLAEYPGFDAVYCGWSRDGKEVVPVVQGDLTFDLLSGVNLVYSNTIMMKKDVALGIGGWDERFNRNQEAVFLLRYFSCGYKIGVVSEILVEFDVSDRSNASDPKRNEEDFDLFLGMHQKNIEACSAKMKNAKSIIYSYRYRGVLLCYLKNKHFSSAVRLYLKMMKIIPARFNKDLLIYISKKLAKKQLYE